MLSSAASTMRRELTASFIQSVRSRSSRIAFRKNACSRSANVRSAWPRLIGAKIVAIIEEFQARGSLALG
jgi:hypothetical protein